MGKYFSIYDALFEVSGNSQRIYKSAQVITEVLESQGFKPAELRTSITGIEKIILSDGTIIQPDIGGFIDRDMSEIMGGIAQDGTIMLNHTNRWYSISGYFKRNGAVSLRVHLKVDGILDKKGLPNGNELSVMVIPENRGAYRPVRDFQHEIDAIYKELSKIKWSRFRRQIEYWKGVLKQYV